MKIDNIHKMVGRKLTQDWIVEDIETLDQFYTFKIEKSVSVYDPTSFTPVRRIHTQKLTLERGLTKNRTYYLYRDKDGLRTELSPNTLKDMILFEYKMNELINR